MFYETITVGSSPLLLLSAILNKKNGDNSAIVSGKSKIGGSWATENLFGYECDNGPHLLYYNFTNRNQVFSFLKDSIGIGIEEYNITPVGERNIFGLRFPELSISNKIGNRYLIFLWFREIMIKILIKLGLIKKRYYFKFIGGTGQMLRSFLKKINILGIQIYDNIDVKTINYNSQNNYYELWLVDGTYLQARSLIISKRVNCIFSYDHKIVSVSYVHENLCMTHLFVKDNKIDKFSYYNFFNSQYFFIVANITDTINKENIDQNFDIISFCLKKNVSHDEVSIDSYIDVLKSKKLISEFARIDHLEYKTIQTSSISDASIKLLESTFRDIKILSFNNLMTGFYTILKENKLLTFFLLYFLYA